MKREDKPLRLGAAVWMIIFILCLLAEPHSIRADAVSPGIPPPPPVPTSVSRQPLGAVSLSFTDENYLTYLPLTRNQNGLLQVDPHSRSDSLSFYLRYYQVLTDIPIGWSGDQNRCIPGTTSVEFQAAILKRINYFRAMAGVPAGIVFTPEANRQAQAAALMMSANGKLSHNPPPTWQCYSQDGDAGAGSSNLFLGVYGWEAITGYMQDPGGGNSPVGHRRWILYPQTQEMGTGDVPYHNGFPGSNALLVFDSHMWENRPAVRDEFVAWPPPGFVPYPVVFPRWSFSYPQADFSAALVTMTSSGTSISIVQSPVVNGYGENTLVWIPLGLHDSQNWPQPQADTTYTVSISNVKIANLTRNFTYDVIVYDPGS